MISARHLLEGKWAGNIPVNTIYQYIVLKHDLNTHAGLILLHSSVIELLNTVSIVDLPQWRVTTAVTNNVRSSWKPPWNMK